MADIAEIVPESAVEVNAEGDKEIKNVCEVVEGKPVSEQGDSAVPSCEDAVDKTVKESSVDVDTSEKPAESGAHDEHMEEACTTEVAADTTDETPVGGVKRKSEEDEDNSEANDDSKKVKTDDSEKVESSQPVTQSSEEPAVVNGVSIPENNGCHDAPNHDAPDATNGPSCEDIPPEIVTKTVEEAMKQPEDIAASS